jgi:hypothetical protein
MSITENGQRKRLSKHDVAIKQLLSQAISGNPSAQRMYFHLLQQALENGATDNAGKKDKVRDFTDEELKMIIAADLKKKNKKLKGTHTESRNESVTMPPQQSRAMIPAASAEKRETAFR